MKKNKKLYTQLNIILFLVAFLMEVYVVTFKKNEHLFMIGAVISIGVSIFLIEDIFSYFQKENFSKEMKEEEENLQKEICENLEKLTASQIEKQDQMIQVMHQVLQSNVKTKQDVLNQEKRYFATLAKKNQESMRILEESLVKALEGLKEVRQVEETLVEKEEALFQPEEIVAEEAPVIEEINDTKVEEVPEDFLSELLGEEEPVALEEVPVVEESIDTNTEEMDTIPEDFLSELLGEEETVTEETPRDEEITEEASEEVNTISEDFLNELLGEENETEEQTIEEALKGAIEESDIEVNTLGEIGEPELEQMDTIGDDFLKELGMEAIEETPEEQEEVPEISPEEISEWLDAMGMTKEEIGMVEEEVKVEEIEEEEEQPVLPEVEVEKEEPEEKDEEAAMDELLQQLMQG